MAAAKQRVAVETIVLIGLLGAISIFLSVTRIGYVPLPNFSGSATVVHVPAILAGVLGGPFAGAAVGLVWGGFSWMTAEVPLFADPLVAIVPRILVGIVVALVWRALRTRHRMLALGLAAWFGSVTNTALVLALAVLRKYMPIEGVVTAIPQAIAEQVLAVTLTLAVGGAYLRMRPDIRYERSAAFVPEPIEGDTGGIRLEAVAHAYRTGDEPVCALRGVDLRVRPGEVLAVLGRNGSGKSTLARQLNALHRPSEGRVLVDGMDTRDPACTPEIRERVGMVFQNPDNQLVATVVADDIAFGAENLGLEPEVIAERIDVVSARLGIRDLLDAEPASLSGGEKQLVALAGVLVMRPRYLVLDEPAAMLSEADAERVRDAVFSLRGEQSVVLITHRIEDAAHADRIAVLDQGRLVLEGGPRAVFAEADRLRECGLEPPAVTELARLLELEHGIGLAQIPLNADELAEGLRARTG